MSLLDVCNLRYNSTNASVRHAETGTANISRHHYVTACVQHHSRSQHVDKLIIIPYAAIFLLSVVGNSLVVATLARHKKMRTITNMYLLNLSLSDLLLAVFCMPFSLIPMLMREFVFGPVLCVLIRYAQGE